MKKLFFFVCVMTGMALHTFAQTPIEWQEELKKDLPAAPKILLVAQDTKNLCAQVGNEILYTSNTLYWKSVNSSFESMVYLFSIGEWDEDFNLVREMELKECSLNPEGFQFLVHFNFQDPLWIFEKEGVIQITSIH